MHQWPHAFHIWIYHFQSIKSQKDQFQLVFLLKSQSHLLPHMTLLMNPQKKIYSLSCFIVIINLMLINLRKKQSSSSVLNLTTVVDSQIDESFAQSTISKRFTRKKNTSNQHNRNLRQGKPNEPFIADNQSSSKQQHRTGKNMNNMVKPEDLFLRITHTPTKNKNYYTPASSDRATQSTYLKSRYETEIISLHNLSSKKQCAQLMRQQLQLKTNQLMLLEDEVMRLKRDISNKEEDCMKSNIRKQKQHQNEVNKLKEEIKSLKAQLQQKNTEIKQLKKNEVAFNREIKSAKYDKLIIQKQIQQIYKKRLPKQLKQLLSFREISLMKQIQQLKQKIQQSKSENEIKLEAQLQKIKQQNNEKQSHIKRLEVHTRTLNKRITEYENDVKQKNQSFSKFYVAIKQSNNDLKEQLKKVRKQNLKLKSLHKLNHPHHTIKKRHHIHSSSQESLSLSLSSNN